METQFLRIILRTVYHRVFLFSMLIGLGDNTSPDVFKFTRSKVKVTWVTFVINYFNSFYWTSLKLLIIKPKGTDPISIHEVTSCQSSQFYNMDLFITGLSFYQKPHWASVCSFWISALTSEEEETLFDRSQWGSSLWARTPTHRTPSNAI